MNHERTLQEAARIYARTQAIDCTQVEHDAARAWQLKDPAHRKAYELAERVSSGVSALAVDDRFKDRLRALSDEPLSAYAAAPTNAKSERLKSSLRSWRIAGALAATLVLAVLGSWQIPGFLASPATTYESTAHERRVVNLDDGSSVQLDVGTRIEVRMSGNSRRIQLLSGRALFEVAHDSSRPFSVTAAGSRTTALGTKFQVERTDTNVIVTLTEGSVAVDQYQNHLVGIGWNERLVPGEQISIDIQNHRSQRRLVDIHSTTSWTQGRHIFRGMPLKAAIEEVNRYAETKVRIGDPSLATLPVAGNFIVGDSEVVVEALAAVLPVRAVSNANQEIVLFRSYSR